MRGGEPVKTNAGRRKNTVPSGRNAGAAVCPYGSRRNRAGGDATVFIIDKAACGLCTRLINFGGNEGGMRKRGRPPAFREMAVRMLFVFGRNALKQGHPDRIEAPGGHVSVGENPRMAVSVTGQVRADPGHAEDRFPPGETASAGSGLKNRIGDLPREK